MADPFRPPPQQPSPKRDNSTLLRLAAMIPLAMSRGGQDAVAGLLHGYQQESARLEQQGYQRGVQQQQLTRQATQDEQMAKDRQLQQQYENQQRQMQFLEYAQKAGADITSPEEAFAKLQGLTSMAGSYGVPQVAVEAAMPSPSRMQKRALAEFVKRVDEQYKDYPVEQRNAMTTQIAGLDKPVTVGEARQMLVGATGPMPQMVPTPKPETRSLDVQAADALKAGDTATYERLKKVADEMSGARRADQNPVVAELQQLRLEQARNAASSGNLPPRIQQAVNSQAKGWDSLPIVKNVQKQAEAVSFTEEMKKDPGNPANDIGLIYAFAKAMDPDSVVREGEYATVQKYAQSWAQTFGFNAQRIFSNVPFLSQQARDNMARTIRAKYVVGKQQYDNVRRSYAAKINKLTGSGDGEQYLTDYAGGFPSEAPTTVGPPGTPTYQDYLRRKGAQ